MFSRVGGNSPALTSGSYSGAQLEEWLFPDEITEHMDVAGFAREKGLDTLRVWLDYSTASDPFAEGVQSLYDALGKRGIHTELYVHDDGHDIHNIQPKMEDYLRLYCGSGNE